MTFLDWYAFQGFYMVVGIGIVAAVLAAAVAFAWLQR